MDVESRESDWKQVQEIRQALNFIIFNLSSDLLGFLVCSDRSKVANNNQKLSNIYIDGTKFRS